MCDWIHLPLALSLFMRFVRCFRFIRCYYFVVFLLFAIFHFSLYSHQCQVISLHWPGFGLCVRWACRVILKLLVEPMLCISKYATFSKNMRFFDLTIPNKRTHKPRPIRQPHSRMYKIITFQAIYNPVNAGKKRNVCTIFIENEENSTSARNAKHIFYHSLW